MNNKYLGSFLMALALLVLLGVFSRKIYIFKV